MPRRRAVVRGYGRLPVSLVSDYDMRAFPYVVGAAIAGILLGWFARELNEYLRSLQKKNGKDEDP